MRWFGAANRFFYRVSVDPLRGELLKLIALLLSFPCFKINHFFFKLAYASQHRHLIRLGRDCARQGGTDLSLHFADLALDKRGIAHTERRLRYIVSVLKSARGGSNGGHIDHGNRS